MALDFPTSPTNGQEYTIGNNTYVWDSTATVWDLKPVTGGASTLVDLTDTTISTPTDAQVLTYDTATSKWINSTPSAGGGIGEFIGTGNIAVSQDNSAGSSVTIGAYNTTMSIFAGDAITSGSNNLCIGGNSGTSITTTSGNVALGSNAGRFIKGSSNIAVGQSALFGNSTTFTGSFNTGVGFETGQSLTTGQYNVLNGYQAGYSLTSGSDNVALGRFALKGAGGAYNIGIGYQAGVSINGGTKNILLGYNAGYSVTSGTDNVFIGSNASQNSGGSNSVGIGSFAGGSGSKSVSIGYQAGKNDTASDKLHIANNSTESLIEGNFSARTLTVNGSLDVEAITVGGAAIGGGAMELISTVDVTASVASVEFTGLSGYDSYTLVFNNITLSVSARVDMLLSKDSGTTWESTYKDGATSRAHIDLTQDSTIVDDFAGTVNIYNMLSALTYTRAFFNTTYALSAGQCDTGLDTAGAATKYVTDGIKILTSTGTIDSGTFSLYGIKG